MKLHCFSSKHMDLYTLTEKLKNQMLTCVFPRHNGKKEKLPDQLGVIDSMTLESLKLGDWNIFNALWVSSPLVYGVLPGIIVILLVSGLSFSGQAT